MKHCKCCAGRAQLRVKEHRDWCANALWRMVSLTILPKRIATERQRKRDLIMTSDAFAFALVVAQLTCPLRLQNVHPRLPDACRAEDVSRPDQYPTMCSSALQYPPRGYSHMSNEFAPWLFLGLVVYNTCCGLFVCAVGCVSAVLSLCVRCSPSVGTTCAP